MNILDLDIVFVWLDGAFQKAVQQNGWFRKSDNHGGSNPEYLYNLRQSMYLLETLTPDELINLASEGKIKGLPVDAIDEKKCLDTIKKYCQTDIDSGLINEFEMFCRSYYGYLLGSDSRNIENVIEYIKAGKSSLIVSNWKRNKKDFLYLEELRSVFETLLKTVNES
jgi:hypothetical protein